MKITTRSIILILVDVYDKTFDEAEIILGGRPKEGALMLDKGSTERFTIQTEEFPYPVTTGRDLAGHEMAVKLGDLIAEDNNQDGVKTKRKMLKQKSEKKSEKQPGKKIEKNLEDEILERPKKNPDLDAELKERPKVPRTGCGKVKGNDKVKVWLQNVSFDNAPDAAREEVKKVGES